MKYYSFFARVLRGLQLNKTLFFFFTENVALFKGKKIPEDMNSPCILSIYTP